MKALLVIALSIVALLSAAVAWLIFDRIEQRRDFDSLTSHFNALEEGSVLQVEFDALALEVGELSAKSAEALENFSKLVAVSRIQMDRVGEIESKMDAVISAHDDLVRMHNFVAGQVKNVEDEIEDARRQARLNNLLSR